MGVLRKLAQQSAIYGISTILGRLLSYLLTPYYTRLFAPEEYGIITDLYALIPFALVLLTMGMESSYFRFSTRAEEESGGDEAEMARRKGVLFGTTWGVTILLSMLFLAVIVAFRDGVSAMMGAVYVLQPELVVAVAAIIFFDVVACVPFARLREQGQANRYVLLKLFNIILQVGFAVAFGVMGLFSTDLGVGWVLVANLVASVITLVVLVAMSRPYVLPKINWVLLSAVMVYSLPLLLSGVAGTATEYIDRQLIKYLIPDGAMAQLGLYGAITKIGVMMLLFTQMYRLAAEPYFLSNFKKEEFVESNAEAMKYYMIATIGIFLGITLFRDLFILIVGRDFREGMAILPVVLISNLLMGVWLNLSFWYKREEKTHFSLYITLAGLVATVGANIVLIPQWGYFGAAWARLICEVVMVALSFYFMRRYYPIPYDLRRIGEYVVVAAVIFTLGEWAFERFDGLWVHMAIATVLMASYKCFAGWREKINVVAMLKGIFRR